MPTKVLAGHRLRWTIREIGRALDGEQVFRALFAAEPVAFWLDSGLVGTGLGRVSVLGTTTGSDAEVLVRRRSDVFTELETTLVSRQAALGDVPPELADVFCGGYVGFFGYELKEFTGGDVVHESVTPDAVWIWANRFVVIDHSRDRTLLVGVHDEASRAEVEAWLDRAAPVGPVRRAPTRPVIASLDLEAHLEQPRERYLDGIDRCREALEAGESFEICLTNRVRLPPVRDPFEFYLWQRSRNPAPYAAFLRCGDLAIASSSPERFLTVDAGGWAECRPIKGTAPRLSDPYADQQIAARLSTDEKTRAENLMIVDLIRNDLGRVSRPGTVQVPQLMRVETYETLHQLVTTVRGRLRAGLTAMDAVRACFPPGSMTGAPKIRTMQLIDSLEFSARGPYSGALGWMSVDGRADLSVVIRTAVLSPSSTVVGAGGAIVLDSDPVAEYEEMLLKATAAVRGR